MRKLWGGAFGSEPNEIAAAFGQSIESDLTFWREDVEGSIAHARMLGTTGILSSEEAAEIERGLRQIVAEGPDALPAEVEDIHAAIEFRLGELIGPVAGKLHTARSRNDQVATDVRLWIRAQLPLLENQIKSLQATLVRRANEHQATIMPGVTHQQHAQPITLGFHLLAIFWMLQRHGYRLRQIGVLNDASPLGSAALAGTPWPIDRQLTADELGFAGPLPNALDATSDRSLILDLLHALALVMIDLSRISQELVSWTGPEFRFVQLSDALTTGSSIMPQKRNPDMAELIRGRSSRVMSNWVALATLMKGLVLGYNRDTQDDKPPLFESVRLTLASLKLMELMWDSATVNTARMRESVHGDFSTATDLADALARSGMPFREAHELTGKVVRWCMERNRVLEDLTACDLAEIDTRLPVSVLASLSPEASIASRESYGGTGPRAVAQQLAEAQKLLEEPSFERPYPFSRS